jgi:hypothetical protein
LGSHGGVTFPVAPYCSERFSADIEMTARQFPNGSHEFLAELKKVYTKYDWELIGPPPG